jgi:predicted enzyme related to lactoylglutathione lyase
MDNLIRTPLISEVDCVQLYVDDLDAGIGFYRDRLGHELIWRSEFAVGLRLPNTNAELVLQVQRQEPETDLVVESADEAAARFESAGGSIVTQPFDNQIGRCVVVEDPWGNRLFLQDRNKGTLLTDDIGNVVGISKEAGQ